MTIQSLGVGSGLALDDLVTQLLDAERTPKQEALTAREEANEAEISALGQIKSTLSSFKDALDDLRSDVDINGREPTVSNPNEDEEILTAEASSSALRGSYEIAVTSLASGSRIETDSADDGGFSSSDDAVLNTGSGSGSLTFQVDGTGDTFTINIAEGTTLAQLREQINSDDNNFGVTANIIDTGTADGGAILVFSSEVAGSGNDLKIVNDNDIADLNRLSTVSSDGLSSYLSASAATNAVATIDGIEVQSSSNEFENTIQNVSFTAEKLSPTDTDGNFLASTLNIGYDKEGLEEKIRKFVETYNGVIDEINTLTRYGESELEDDGALAGDSMIRSIQNGMATLVGGNVSSSALGGLFQIGIEIDSDGKLEIGSTDIGLGSGEERLEDALDDYFDDIASLFTDEDEGIATVLYDFVNSYSRSGGMLALRETAAKEERDEIYDDWERLELRMSNYEEVLRAKYTSLDQTVAGLQSTGTALLAALG